MQRKLEMQTEGHTVWIDRRTNRQMVAASQTETAERGEAGENRRARYVLEGGSLNTRSVENRAGSQPRVK